MPAQWQGFQILIWHHQYVQASPIAPYNPSPSFPALPARCAPPRAFHFPIRNDPALHPRCAPARPHGPLKFPQNSMVPMSPVRSCTHNPGLQPPALEMRNGAITIFLPPLSWLPGGLSAASFTFETMYMLYMRCYNADWGLAKYFPACAPYVRIGTDPATIPPFAPAASNDPRKIP